VIVCGKCGHENSDNRRFCEVCDEVLDWTGKKLSAAMATVTPTEVSVAPGAEATLQLRVFNRGSIVDNFSLEISGPAASWTKIEPDTLHLWPNAQGDATVRLNPPRSPTVQAGTVPFTLKATSRVNPQATAEASGQITVGAFVELAGTLVPQTSRSTGSAEHEVKITNNGNKLAAVSITLSNPDDQLAFQLTPEAATLQPGQDAVLKLLVGPRDQNTTAQGAPQPFQLSIKAPDAAEVKLEGAYLRLTTVQLQGSIEPEESRSAGTAEHWVTVTNHGNSPANVNIMASDPQELLTFQVTPSNLTIAPEQSARARLWVGLRRRTDVLRGQPLPFQVVARAGESSPVELSATYTPLFVELSGMLEPHTSRGAGNAQHSLTVMNQGNVPARVTVAATDAAEELAFNFTPPVVDVDPGQSARVTLWVSLRQARDSGNGEPKPFEVVLNAPETAGVKVPGAFIPLFAELTGALDPPSSKGTGTGEHWVNVTNKGNLHAGAMISARDPNEFFTFEITPQWLTLEPGAAAQARLWVFPRKQPREGTEEPRPFQVQIASNEAPSITLEGTRIQVPQARPDRWPKGSMTLLLRWLLALAILAVAAFIALSTTDNTFAIISGSMKFVVPVVSIAVIALGILGFLIFVPGRRWFIAVGILAAGAFGVWMIASQSSLSLPSAGLPPDPRA
jgi:P pilus assembly chaperone PapD